MAAFFELLPRPQALCRLSASGKAVRNVMESKSMRALGYNTRSYKLLAYGLSGAIASLARGLSPSSNFFVTPDLLSWVFSGQLGSSW